MQFVTKTEMLNRHLYKKFEGNWKRAFVFAVFGKPVDFKLINIKILVVFQSSEKISKTFSLPLAELV